MQTEAKLILLLIKFYRILFLCSHLYQESRYQYEDINFLLSICVDELISAPNIITLLPNPLPSHIEKLSRASNPRPCPE